MILHDYWENKTTYWLQSHPSPLMTHTGKAMTVELYRSTHSTQCVSSVAIHIATSAFTSSRVLDQFQHNSESKQGDWMTPCTWWGWERGGVHIWTTLREEQTQDGVNPWTDHSKQPFWNCSYSAAGYVHVSTCSGSYIWVKSLQLHTETLKAAVKGSTHTVASRGSAFNYGDYIIRYIQCIGAGAAV